MDSLDIIKQIYKSKYSSSDNSLSEHESVQDNKGTKPIGNTPIKKDTSIRAREQYIIPSRFDEKQKSVICLDEGLHLVLAPAGCGKTDILAQRVYRAL